MGIWFIVTVIIVLFTVTGFGLFILSSELLALKKRVDDLDGVRKD